MLLTALVLSLCSVVRADVARMPTGPAPHPLVRIANHEFWEGFQHELRLSAALDPVSQVTALANMSGQLLKAPREDDLSYLADLTGDRGEFLKTIHTKDSVEAGKLFARVYMDRNTQTRVDAAMRSVLDEFHRKFLAANNRKKLNSLLSASIRKTQLLEAFGGPSLESIPHYVKEWRGQVEAKTTFLCLTDKSNPFSLQLTGTQSPPISSSAQKAVNAYIRAHAAPLEKSPPRLRPEEPVREWFVANSLIAGFESAFSEKMGRFRLHYNQTRHQILYEDELGEHLIVEVRSRASDLSGDPRITVQVFPNALGINYDVIPSFVKTALALGGIGLEPGGMNELTGFSVKPTAVTVENALTSASPLH